MGVSNKTPQFINMNPIGKVFFIILSFIHSIIINFYLNHYFFQVPVLETPNGPVFESNAIARYGMYTFYTVFSSFIPFSLLLMFLQLTFLQFPDWVKTTCLDHLSFIR